MKFLYEYRAPNGWTPVVYHGHIDTTYQKIVRTPPIEVPEDCIDIDGSPNFGKLISQNPAPEYIPEM